MKNIIYLSLVFLFLLGCDEGDKGMFIERYFFEDIIYTLEKEDGVKEDKFFPLASELSNSGDTIVYETVNLLGGVENDSRFSSDDERAFSLLEQQTVIVKVPIAINNDNEIVLSDYASFKYSDETESSLSDVDGTYIVEIPPYQKVKVFRTVIVDRINVTYTIILRTEVSGKELRIKGKWRGSVIKHVEADCEFSNIN